MLTLSTLDEDEDYVSPFSLFAHVTKNEPSQQARTLLRVFLCVNTTEFYEVAKMVIDPLSVNGIIKPESILIYTVRRMSFLSYLMCFCVPLSSRSRFCTFANAVSEDLLIRWLLCWVNKPVLLRGRMWGFLIQTTEPAFLSATTIVQILSVSRLSFYLKRNNRGGAASWPSHVVLLTVWQGSGFHSPVQSEKEREKVWQIKEREGENIHYRTVMCGKRDKC